MRVREGFALRDVIAVLGLIVMPLLAIMPVACERNTRRPASRTVIINNLKQIGLAAHSFNDQFKRLPKAWNLIPSSKEVWSTPLGQMAEFYEVNFGTLINQNDGDADDISFTGTQVATDPRAAPTAVAKNPYTSIALNYYLFGDPATGVFPGMPVAAAEPHGSPLAINTIRDGSSNTLLSATCFAICKQDGNEFPVRINEVPGSPGSPFFSAANGGNGVNWQSISAVTACDPTPGKRAQAYTPTGIQVGLADGTARTIMAPNINNAQWNGALAPMDKSYPTWD